MRVLLVEDNPELRLLFEVGLKKFFQTLQSEVEVQTAYDGADGLEIYKRAREENQPFDLIVTDAAMPRMDGFQMAEHIRTKYHDEQTIIAFLTAFDEPMMAVRANMKNIAGTWIKPVTPIQLGERIENILQKIRFERMNL